MYKFPISGQHGSMYWPSKHFNLRSFPTGVTLSILVSFAVQRPKKYQKLNTFWQETQLIMLLKCWCFQKLRQIFFDLTIENVKRGKFYSIICHVIDVRELQQSTRYKLWYFDEKVKVKVDYRVLDVAKSIGILSYYYNLFIQKLYSLIEQG